MSKITKHTEELVTPILTKMDLELVDIVFEKEGANSFLRVYIDKAGGVDIEECSKVSEQLSEKLDEADPITEAYFLEVSSPGVERPLKKKEDFQAHVGSYVYIKSFEPISGEKEFTGTIKEFENDTIYLTYKDKTKEKEVEIPFAKVAKAHLAVTFD
ncbi:ribosome maturation factor RimP [Gracilibacillus halotolerans]|uniref:Ribosome maturation factor RimP n=1 Tax=Gracilibacillus halotolerans TaxID=74386 RepID=A0A841RJ11_9BACI|nr:ribosome maturation factor RimP [Gracilibacillus halotolerans]MBB6511476.1 ribosome maturation factor RimP [Gracilibacillus halotolerans]